MEATAEKQPEIIPVGTGRDDVLVSLDIVSKTQTRIRVFIASEMKNDPVAKSIADTIAGQEMLCLRKVGYEKVAEIFSITEVKGKPFILREHVFKWTDWKYRVMKMVKPI